MSALRVAFNPKARRFPWRVLNASGRVLYVRATEREARQLARLSPVEKPETRTLQSAERDGEP